MQINIFSSHILQSYHYLRLLPQISVHFVCRSYAIIQLRCRKGTKVEERRGKRGKTTAGHTQRKPVAHAVIGANLCARDPLEVTGKGIREVGGVTDKEACTVHTINIISQRQYFVAHCLSSYVGLHSMCVCFPSMCTLVT
jgi:hypothetical protein